MPIEIRQLVIRSLVDAGPGREDDAAPDIRAAEANDLKAEILAECKAWLEDQLQRLRER